jgi:hypothetical protein
MVDELFKNSKFSVKFRNRPMNESLDYQTLGDDSLPTMRAEAGLLRYLADRTRFEILASAGKLGRAAHKPTLNHKAGWKHIVQHLQSTREKKLLLGGKGDFVLFGLTDANYMSKDDSISTLGYAFFLNYNSGSICCRSTRDTTVSSSSAESELKAIDLAVKMCVWLRAFLSELGFPQQAPTVLYSDSKSAESIIKLNKHGSTTAHIIGRFNYVKQEYRAGTFMLKYINTATNTADILTKILAEEPFNRHAETLLAGFHGIPPTEVPLVTEEVYRKRNLTKMRASKAKLAAHRRLHNSRADHSSNMMAIDEREHQVRFKLWHQASPAHCTVIFHDQLETHHKCQSCGTPTCIGYESCNICLIRDHHLEIKSCRIGAPSTRETGLFANDGTPPDRTLRQRILRQRDQSVEDPLFRNRQKIFDYNGEELGSELDMHQRYTFNERGLYGPYCFQRLDGTIVDAALRRGVASLANHGPMNGIHGVQANAVFRTNRAGEIWIEAITNIYNGEQIIVNYDLHYTGIRYFDRNNLHHRTIG